MAFCVRHCPEARLGIIELWGTVTREQIVAGIQALYAPGHWDPSYDVLWDARRLAELILLPEDVVEVVAARERVHHLRPSSRIVLVASRDLDAEIGTLLFRSRSHAQAQDCTRGVVLRSLPDALAYLGRPEIPSPDACATTSHFAGDRG